MELRQLRYFEAAAEELHFTRAAKKLRISQPPLSQQIKALEQEMGVDLFRRVGRHVELTEAGRLFLAECRSIRNQLARAVRLARDAADGEAGHIRIGVSEYTIYDDTLVNAFREFGSRYPRVHLDLTEGPPDQIASKVRNGELDLAIVRFPVEKTQNMICLHVATEKLAVIVPSDHALAGEREISLHQLSQDTMIFCERNDPDSIPQRVQTLFRKINFTPSRRHEAGHFASAVNLVALGIGFCMVTSAGRMIQNRHIRYLDLKEVEDGAELYLIALDTDNSAKNNFISIVSGVINSPATSVDLGLKPRLAH